MHMNLGDDKIKDISQEELKYRMRTKSREKSEKDQLHLKTH